MAGGACVVGGACMAGGVQGRGVCGRGVRGRGCAWQRGMHGGHAWQGACMAGGMCVAGGACVVHMPPDRYYEIRSMSGWYASYWNAFLCTLNSRGRFRIMIDLSSVVTKASASLSLYVLEFKKFTERCTLFWFILNTKSVCGFALFC